MNYAWGSSLSQILDSGRADETRAAMQERDYVMASLEFGLHDIFETCNALTIASSTGVVELEAAALQRSWRT